MRAQRAAGVSGEERAASAWHRMLVHPVTGDVLSFEYTGRYAPDTLKTALMFLHGVCQAPGLPDHNERSELGGLMRAQRAAGVSGEERAASAHHSFKGHGILTWSIGPPPRPQPLVIELYPHPAPPVHVEYAAA